MTMAYAKVSNKNKISEEAMKKIKYTNINVKEYKG